MGRILGIDYGAKRTGIAVTDPLQIIASGLDTVATHELEGFLERYLREETVDKLVIGLPRHSDGNLTALGQQVQGLIKRWGKLYEGLDIVPWAEDFSSVNARRVILESGASKKKRRDKGLVDKVSAVLILEDYMQQMVWSKREML
jgi:putative Holliday junction resolvase